MFVLEDREHALARGATILAEIAGYGSTCDAYHRVQIAPDVAEPVRAIELALADASVAKDEIGYINLHGTSTELNDRMETAAIKKCFGQRAMQIPDELDEVDDRPPAGRLRRGGHWPRTDPVLRAGVCIRPSTWTSPTRNATWITCRTTRGRRRWMWMWRCATASRLGARTAKGW